MVYLINSMHVFIIKSEIIGSINDTRDTYSKRIFHNILYIPSIGYKVAKTI